MERQASAERGAEHVLGGKAVSRARANPPPATRRVVRDRRALLAKLTGSMIQPRVEASSSGSGIDLDEYMDDDDFY